MKDCFRLAWVWLFVHLPVLAAAPVRAIPFGQLGAEAGKQYSGAGISIMPVAGGAELRAVFQDLAAAATAEGLWLESTSDEDCGRPSRFRVRAGAVGRVGTPAARRILSSAGEVRASRDRVVFSRPGLVEEYSVSMDGVRQDFLVVERPPGDGELELALDVAGAVAETACHGVKFVLTGNGREIGYSRLLVTDSTGREFAARMEAVAGDALCIRVDDRAAVYPLRIDPTFSDVDWISMGGVAGVDDAVYAIAVDSAGKVYVGGSFKVAGSVLAEGIAQWDGSDWSGLGGGVDGVVHALAVSGGEVYAGGQFGMAGSVAASNIAKWNGSAWTALGGGTGEAYYDDVRALAVSGSDLYAGGDFTTAGETEVNHIAKWNGSGWSALEGGMDGEVNALAVSGSDLYAGGAFTMAGATAANRVARWNGSAWSAMGTGMDDAVLALAVSGTGTSVYAGGYFTTAGGVVVNCVAKWFNGAWRAMSSGTNDAVFALAAVPAPTSDVVYAGGWFTVAGSLSAVNGVVKWTGSGWSRVGTGVAAGGVTPEVYSLAAYGTTNLCAGGFFGEAGGVAASQVAKWNGSAWSAFGQGLGGSAEPAVNALAVSDTELYIAGSFTAVGGVAAKNIAKWNGNVWSALATGLKGSADARVHALALAGNDLYAGGWFSSAGSVAAANIAKWNGSTWSVLGTGMNNTVRALAVSGTNLYAGGSFTTAGGVTCSRVARWSGSAWSAMGTGMDGAVYALAASGADVWAGGLFLAAGGVPAARVARWNGSTWSALGQGIGGSSQAMIQALAVSGTELYAGGFFSLAGGGAAANIAKWDGSAWSALAGGTNGRVRALAVEGPNVYAAGSFPAAGAVAANAVACWSGSAWSPLGSGLDDDAYALAVSGTNLYVGGLFRIAGGKVSNRLARFDIGATHPDISVEQPAGNRLASGGAGTHFGTVAVGSGSVRKVFTISNTGTADLAIQGIGVTGGEPGEFVFDDTGAASSLVPGGSTTFSVTFAPATLGSRGAALFINNSDPEEGRFELALTGTGVTGQASTEFRILELGEIDSAVMIDHTALAGTDRGGIAVSANRVFVTGDKATSVHRAADLGGGGALGIRLDGLCSDLGTGAVYTLARDGQPLVAGDAVVNQLIELDPDSGAITSNLIPLSESIPVGGDCGVFSGSGRVAIHNGGRVFDILLPAGSVHDLGPMARPDWLASESWAAWGVAEYFSGQLHLAYRRAGSQSIVRTRVADGFTAMIASFSDLGDMASWTVSPQTGRWYFHYQNAGWWLGLEEILGYADASFDIGPAVVAPTITSPATAKAHAGFGFIYQISATGYPDSFAAEGLPEGLTLDSATGLISGVTTETGVHGITVSATNASGTTTAGFTLQVSVASGVAALFSNPAHVDPAREAAHTRATLDLLDFVVVPFAGTGEADWILAFATADVVVIPELERGAIPLSPAAVAAINLNLATTGEGLVVLGGDSWSLQFLNDLRAWSLGHLEPIGPGTISKAAGVTGFTNSPANLDALDTTAPVVTGSLPFDARPVYQTGGATAVFAAGRVAWLGYDWNAGPHPQWDAVLGDAIRDVTGFEPPAEAQIVAQHPAGSALTGDSSIVDFGALVSGLAASRTFVIGNVGAQELTEIEVAISGPHAADFVVTNPPPATLAAGEGTTFSVAFAPPVTGPRAATLRITSSDVDDSPFVVELRGSGEANVPPVAVAGGPYLLGTGSDLVLNGSGSSDPNPSDAIAAYEWDLDNDGQFDDASGAQARVPWVNLAALPRPGPNTIRLRVTDGFGAQASATAQLSILEVRLPDFEWFTGPEDPFDLSWRSLTYVPNGWGGYTLTPVAVITALPHDASSHPLLEEITDGDDKAQSVNLANGRAVPFCGEDHTRFWVSTNGLITFVAGSTDLSESVGEHLASRQIALFWDDLKPGEAGDVRCVQLADRVVVSFVNVAEYESPGRLNAQLELFFDGKIRLSYGEVTIQDCLVGISPGSYTGAADETDLSSIIVAPEISIEQPAGTDLVDGAGGVGFGTVLVGAPASRTFVIRNPGAGELSGLKVTTSGANSAEFVVTDAPATTLAAGDSTTFTVVFTPAQSGTCEAAIHVASNDADENPFDIGLTGIGASSRQLYDSFAAAAGLSGPGAEPEAVPFRDGVENLLKYAFGMDASGPDTRTLVPGSGNSGLPVLRIAATDGSKVFRIEFLRRKRSGLGYLPLQSDGIAPGSWSQAAGDMSVSDIDDDWERVVIEQPFQPQFSPARFFRVGVVLE